MARLGWGPVAGLTGASPAAQVGAPAEAPGALMSGSERHLLMDERRPCLNVCESIAGAAEPMALPSDASVNHPTGS